MFYQFTPLSLHIGILDIKTHFKVCNTLSDVQMRLQWMKAANISDRKGGAGDCTDNKGAFQSLYPC